MLTPEDISSAALGLGFYHPWFLPAIAAVRYVVDEVGTSTAAIDASGLLRVNPTWWATLTKAERRGVIAHELLHVLLRHHERRGTRNLRRWNVACDRATNPVIVQSGLALPKSAIYPPRGREGLAAEELYELESEPDNVIIVACAGCGVESAHDTSGGPVVVHWDELAASARATAKLAGNKSGNAFAQLLEPPAARVKWASVLRRGISLARTVHGNTCASYRHVSRRSGQDGPIFPGKEGRGVAVVVVIDSSASVSDESLATSVAETVAVGHASGVRVYLVVHDTEVQYAGWLKHGFQASAVQSRLRGRGGTCFQPAYAAVEATGGRFDVLVHLTDGECYECEWPSTPTNVRKLIVALVGYKSRERVPEDAKVIGVE